MTTREFLGRERDLARRYGLRKTDVLFQMVRCADCDAESLLRSRFNRIEFTSVEAIERRVLEVLHRPLSIRCTTCGSEDLDGLGSRHVFLMYSEREAAHLAFTLRMTTEDDGRVRVLRQVWIVPDDGSAEEVELEDDRLGVFWADSQIRARAAHPDPDTAVAQLEDLAPDLPDDPYLLRELGNCLIDAGRTARALAVFELSLRADAEQPQTLRHAGRLHVAFGDPARGAELLRDAWEQSEDDALLPEILRATYRGRQLGALVAAAAELLEVDPESVAARKAIAAAQSVADVGAMQDAWADLAETAGAAGDRTTEAVARFWTDALSLPVPDWTDGVDRADYVRALVDELVDWGFEVEERPEPLSWRDADIPVDIEAVSETGDRWLFLVFDEVSNAVLEHRLTATIRAAREDQRRAGAAVVPLNRQAMNYGAMAMASASPDTELLLAADADTTMAVADENVAAFVVAAERHFGRTLEFDLASLEEVDAILERLHDGGFGEITYAFQCQAAAYVAAVIARLVPDAAWAEGDDGMDPYVFTLPTGEEINLVSKIGKRVRNGAEDGIAHFVGVVLDQMEAP